MTDSLLVDRVLRHQRAELDKADVFRKWSLRLQLAIAGLATLSVFSNDGKMLLTLAIIAGLFIVIWLVLDWRYRVHRSAGDQARRIVLIASGLGDMESDLSIFSDRFSAKLDAIQSVTIEEYFATRAHPGPKRLAEMLDESAFFTGHLQRRSAEVLALRLLILAVGIVAVLIVIAWTMDDDGLVASGRVVLALLVFILSADVIGAAMRHREAGAEMAGIRQRIDAARARNYRLGEVLLLVSDYNAAVEGAPLPLPGLYRKELDRLNADWAEYKVAIGLGQ